MRQSIILIGGGASSGCPVFRSAIPSFSRSFCFFSPFLAVSQYFVVPLQRIKK
jgi:hypothetical protein